MSARGVDRRQASRFMTADDHGVVSIKIRPGHAASLVDVSASGVMVETAYRLLPGTVVELHLDTETHRDTVRGRVVRCEVVAVCAAALSYRGAVSFDRHLSWFAAEEGYAVPGAEPRAGIRNGAPVTPGVV